MHDNKSNQENKTQDSFHNKEFLQSLEWKNFQESLGRNTHLLSQNNLWSIIVEQILPIVGKYFYLPKGPIALNKKDDHIDTKNYSEELIKLARKNNAGWIRIEPETEKLLKLLQENTKHKIVKAPHNTQPKEIFAIDIAKSEAELLTEMKPKTRYNIRLAQKKKVEIFFTREENYVEEFIRLTNVMASRNGITPHPENHYRQMLKNIPENTLKLYIAKFEEKIIVANLIVFFGNTCTYLHGASDDEYRNVMAPYLLQWQQICDAKKNGCLKYDFGGVALQQKNRSWEGITKFKTGFSPSTPTTIFPGSFDIIIDPRSYWTYRGLQKAKKMMRR